MIENLVSTIIPVHNRAAMLCEAVESVLAQDWRPIEIVIVDDGSTDDTAGVLAGLSLQHPAVQVLRQANAGRMAARTKGLEQASGEMVLFLDSRVLLRPGSLTFVAEHLSKDALVWNGHVHVSTTGNRYALFWDALTRLAWSAYFRSPRTTSYASEDFDRYPKGTTCFLAPREVLLEAWDSFTTYYADSRFANDDTSVIRTIAARHRIWLSPGFACDYASRQTARQFVRHARARGTVFVDGHLRRESRFAPVILAFFPLSVAAVAVVAWHWWVPAALLLATAAAAGTFVAARLDRPSGAAVATMTPAFVISFGLGMWKGAALALRHRVAA